MSTKLEEIIENHVYMSMGFGLLPLPFFDVVAITGVQLSLTKKLAEWYNIPFSQEMGKNILGALTGGCFSVSVGSLMFSVTKIVPVVGTAVGVASSSIIAGASTYALGRVFNRHFSEGGTLLSFDSDKARSFYKEMFKEGQEIAQAPHRFPKFFDLEEVEGGVMTILGKIITGLDTLTNSKSTMFAINKGISKYGRLSHLDIDKTKRKISASVILKGEEIPTEIILEDYAIKKKDASTEIVFKHATSDKVWLTAILHDFVIGEFFEIPEGKEKLIEELLGVE